ncbi:MAG: hypothetical protein KGH61_04765 [Candidatus Micrarchaeota archaeon]|nr:hypothetical protein [Candidatus Micrarchaeota archaeon]MDE1848229.1 hypothetical protein [Candidatus Micrarchaeota archaeon]MDE1864884.1 hypothetical protein [Candidatus Micrarchaeota archaeon]
MASKLRGALHHFFATTKRGYDQTYWIFMIIAGASIVTKLFGIGGAGDSVIVFALFYIVGRLSISREMKIARKRSGHSSR